MRRSSIVLGLVGSVLLILAVVTRFVVLPMGSKLPANTNVTVHYAGTGTLLNAKALQSGDTAHALEQNVPVTVDRHIQAKSTHGKTALVDDDTTLNAPGGVAIPDKHVYAISRTTLTGASAPTGTTAEPVRDGLTIGWPIGPKPNDSYKAYDSATQSVVPAVFTGKGATQGRSTYGYKYSATAPVKDPTLLAGLPKSLPKSLVASLAPLLPAAVKAQVNPVFATLADPVPLTYTAIVNVTADVDRQTGLPINETLQQQIVASLRVGGKTISLIPVLAINVKMTAGSIKSSAKKASDAGRLLTVIGVVTPIVLLVLGLALIALAYVRRSPKITSEPTSRDRLLMGA